MKIVRVISGKAGLPIGSCYTPSAEDDFNYWFDELGSVESPVKSATAYKREWFDVVEDVSLVEATLIDHTKQIEKNKSTAGGANSKAKAAQASADEAQKTANEALELANKNTGGSVSDNITWTRDTEYTYKDIFSMSGSQYLKPLNGYSVLWLRQNGTTKSLQYRNLPAGAEYGLSISSWTQVYLVNLTDLTKPFVTITSCPIKDNDIFINVSYTEVTNAVQK